MLRGVLDRLVARLRSDGSADDETGDSRFVPSVLDTSVRYAHGMRDARAERELADIEEEARRLEEQHREK